MKSARLGDFREIIFEDIPVPELGDNDALVKVKYCGICGTDVASFRSHEFFSAGVYLGHEMSGVVAEVGKSVKKWQPGDKVAINTVGPCGKCYACRHGFLSNCPHLLDEAIGTLTDRTLPGGFSEFVRVTEADKKLFSIDGVSFEEAALAVPLGETLHAARISKFRPRDAVMVIGCGPMGLATMIFLKNGGAGTVIATDVNSNRMEKAKRLGADYVFNPMITPNLKEEVLALTDGLGVDLVFECSGAHRAFQSAIDFLRPKGQLVVVGVISAEVGIVPLNYQLGEFQMQASWCQTDEFPLVIDFLKKKVAPMNELVTSKIKLDDIVAQGFNELLKPDNDELKIMVSPD